VLRRGDDDEDEPPPRRSSGETGKAFVLAARDTLQHIARIPVEAYAATSLWLSDTLDWLNLWEANSSDEALDYDYDNAQQSGNISSLHL